MTNGTHWGALLGESEAMYRLRAMIKKVAPTDLPVLIQGPTGAGKELVAHALHEMSRRQGPLVACNVCAVPDQLFEDSLFGHVRGAFSGATDNKFGLMTDANGGTLFLDEIGGLAVAIQAKLLRAIEFKEFRPVGAQADRRSDFRVISATHEDLDAYVADDRFRLDLLQRIGAIRLRVPSLDERADDIPQLARHFLRETGGTASPYCLTDEAILFLAHQRWPGNVRQLKHVVVAAAIFADGPDVDVDAVTAAVGSHNETSAAVGDQDAARARLVAILRDHGWRKGHAANALGVHRATLARWLRELGINTPDRAAIWK